MEKRYCQLTGHETNEIIKICNNRNCNNYPRWICQECTNQRLHRHEPLGSYPMDFNEYRRRVLLTNYQTFQERANLIDSYYTKYLNEIQQFMSKLKFETKYKDNQQMEQTFKMFQENPFSLSNKQLHSLMIFQSDIIKDYKQVYRNLKFVISQLDELLDGFNKIIYQLTSRGTLLCIQQHVNNFQNQKSYQPIVNSSIKDFSFGARVSPNESRVVYCNSNGKLQLNHTFSCKNIGTISQKFEVDIVSFTQNSKQLIMCQLGTMKIFRMGRIFKLQSKIKLNDQQKISKLIIIDSNQILIKQKESTIIIEDIVNHRQNLKLELNLDCTLEIDYDQERQEIIIGQKNEICFYSNNGKLLFTLKLQNIKLIQQLQKIKNSNKILIQTYNILMVISVDYETQNYTPTRQCSNISHHNFSLLCDNSLIALVTEYVIFVLDIDLQTIQLIPYSNQYRQDKKRGIQQQDSLSFIILQDESTLEIIRLSDPK